MKRNPSLNRVIAANIEGELKLRNMKHRDFAKKIGIGQSALSNKMTGRAPWTDENMELTCRALKIPIINLVTRREEQE